MNNKTMREKREVDAHMENFNFETMTLNDVGKWVSKLESLLIKYYMARGR